MRKDAAGSYGASPVVRCFLAQSQMGSIVVIIADIVRKETPQVALIQGDHVIPA